MSLKHLRPQLESVPLFHLQGADSQRGLVTDDKAREPSLGLVSCVLVRWTPLHRVPHRLCHKSTQPPAPALWEPSWKPTKAGDSQCGPPPDSEDPRCHEETGVCATKPGTVKAQRGGFWAGEGWKEVGLGQGTGPLPRKGSDTRGHSASFVSPGTSSGSWGEDQEGRARLLSLAA